MFIKLHIDHFTRLSKVSSIAKYFCTFFPFLPFLAQFLLLLHFDYLITPYVSIIHNLHSYKYRSYKNDRFTLFWSFTHFKLHSIYIYIYNHIHLSLVILQVLLGLLLCISYSFILPSFIMLLGPEIPIIAFYLA